MKNKIIKLAYKFGYSIDRVLRIFKPVTKKTTFTKQEVLEYCLDSNKYFANTNPELVFDDEEIRHLISLANN